MSAGKFEKYRTVWTTHVVVSRIVRGVYIFNNGDNTMPLKKAFAHARAATASQSAWIVRVDRSSHSKRRHSQTNAAGRHRTVHVSHACRRPQRAFLLAARSHRAGGALFRPSCPLGCTRSAHQVWHDRVPAHGERGDPDGCYQVLSVERPEDRLSPELKDAISKVFRKIETQHTGT